jgi:hypothetical protein
MTARPSLGDTALTVRVARLGTSCPSFEEPFPYDVRSPVSVEAFWIFVAALECALPAITTKNMNDMLLLCEEFGFASLLSQVTAFISGHTVVDSEARKRVSGVEERNTEQERELYLLQKEILDLQEASIFGKMVRGSLSSSFIDTAKFSKRQNGEPSPLRAPNERE